MRTLFATLLGTIAVGVLLIAYGLLAPRASAVSPVGPIVYDARGEAYQLVRPNVVGDRFALGANPNAVEFAPRPEAVPVGYNGYDGYGVASARPVPVYQSYPAVYQRGSVPAYQTPAYQTAPAPRRTVSRVERSSGRDWKETALVIGGSSAAGAGIGGIFGGKKGALIGAAIGGGASTLYEATKH
jgi:hypothetical protein